VLHWLLAGKKESNTMKKIVMGLERVESLARLMIEENQSDNDRAIAFAAIKVITDNLLQINKEDNNGDGYVIEKVGLIVWHSQAIAHLDDGNGHSEHQLMSWLRTAISAVKTDVAMGPLIQKDE
jgi:hypothetical protein